MTLSVVGAGFGRTGTNSLKLALEQLGLGRCHHMLEVGPRPDLIRFWAEAARGERRDWETAFAGFGCTVDWPSTYFWRELADYYPRAKIVLSIRPEQDWLRSIHATIHESLSQVEQRPEGPRRDTGRMAYDIVTRRTFSGRLGDAEHALAVYRAHNEEVRRTIAPERLVVLDPSEGWGPLCAGLGLPVPDAPYPHTNTTEQFRARLVMPKPAE
jgi:hypothetical protein